MSARTIEGTSARKAGWVIILLLLAWVVFLVAPFPSKEKPAPTSSLPPVAAQSKLESAGLANNPDWEGLPEYFAVWAGSVDWVGDRTWFAYWNPGSYSYSYFIEATRDGKEIRFRSLSAKPTEGGLELDDDDLAEYAKDRKGDSPTHPFVFAVKLPQSLTVPVPLPAPQWLHGGDPAGKSIEKVEPKTGPQLIPLPPVKFPEQPNDDPKK
jgi:hypothetical protein